MGCESKGGRAASPDDSEHENKTNNRRSPSPENAAVAKQPVPSNIEAAAPVDMKVAASAVNTNANNNIIRAAIRKTETIKVAKPVYLCETNEGDHEPTSRNVHDVAVNTAATATTLLQAKHYTVSSENITSRIPDGLSEGSSSLTPGELNDLTDEETYSLAPEEITVLKHEPCTRATRDVHDVAVNIPAIATALLQAEHYTVSSENIPSRIPDGFSEGSSAHNLGELSDLTDEETYSLAPDEITVLKHEPYTRATREATSGVCTEKNVTMKQTLSKEASRRYACLSMKQKHGNKEQAVPNKVRTGLYTDIGQCAEDKSQDATVKTEPNTPQCNSPVGYYQAKNVGMASLASTEQYTRAYSVDSNEDVIAIAAAEAILKSRKQASADITEPRRNLEEDRELPSSPEPCADDLDLPERSPHGPKAHTSQDAITPGILTSPTAHTGETLLTSQSSETQEQQADDVCRSETPGAYEAPELVPADSSESSAYTDEYRPESPLAHELAREGRPEAHETGECTDTYKPESPVAHEFAAGGRSEQDGVSMPTPYQILEDGIPTALSATAPQLNERQADTPVLPESQTTQEVSLVQTERCSQISVDTDESNEIMDGESTSVHREKMSNNSDEMRNISLDHSNSAPDEVRSARPKQKVIFSESSRSVPEQTVKVKTDRGKNIAQEEATSDLQLVDPPRGDRYERRPVDPGDVPTRFDKDTSLNAAEDKTKINTLQLTSKVREPELLVVTRYGRGVKPLVCHSYPTDHFYRSPRGGSPKRQTESEEKDRSLPPAAARAISEHKTISEAVEKRTLLSNPNNVALLTDRMSSSDKPEETITVPMTDNGQPDF